MIYPVMPYGIAGCIWYQGEANQGRASSYARVMQRLIGSWRTGFNKEFPFYLVQIAPFQYHSKDNGPALLREQQAMLPEMLDKVKMITVSDLVDNVQDIHPRDKRSVGKRLANLALDDTYHIYAGPYKSPVFESACRKSSWSTSSSIGRMTVSESVPRTSESSSSLPSQSTLSGSSKLTSCFVRLYRRRYIRISFSMQREA